MYRSAVRRAVTAAAAALSSPRGEALLPRGFFSLRPSAAATRTIRFYGGGGGLDGPQQQLQQRWRQIAGEMIQYAVGLVRHQKSEDAYAQALLVLSQGLSNLQAGDEGIDDAAGMYLVAMSTLHYERRELIEAMEKLQTILQLEHCSMGTKVAAWEGLVGLNLEAGEDATSLVLADECLQFLRIKKEEKEPANILHFRGKAMKGLAALVSGDVKSAELNFGECEDCESMEGKYRCGNLALSCGEFLHASGNLSLAKDFYERALQISETRDSSKFSSLTAANMVPDEVSLGATCAVGQLLMHSGEFQGAEDNLTKALNKAEAKFGLNHPKVGIVLTCMAMMYGHKAKREHSSSLLIQEGLYRRAMDYLKAPALIDTDVDANMHVPGRDIVALARGGYAEILCIQQNRKQEGERLRKWAENAWTNRRISLVEALEMSDPAKMAIVDTRIRRVL